MSQKNYCGDQWILKYCNRVLNTDTGRNLCVPGKTSEEQQVFVIFFTVVADAINVRHDTLRACFVHAGKLAGSKRSVFGHHLSMLDGCSA